MFGCVAFVYDHTPYTSKLVLCSIIGVLVGYLCTHKGYWVYFLNQCKYIVSFDITFFESTHYFSSTSSSSTSPRAPSVSPIPTSSFSSFITNTSHLPTLMDLAPLLSLSPQSSPTPLRNSLTSPLLMPSRTLSNLISTLVYLLPLANSSTSSSNSMHIALSSDNLHLHIDLLKC